MDLITNAYHQEFLEPAGFPKLVTRLREITGGVLIGIKMAFTNTIEQDIDLAVEAGVDVLPLKGLQLQPGLHRSLKMILGCRHLPACAVPSTTLKNKALRDKSA